MAILDQRIAAEVLDLRARQPAVAAMRADPGADRQRDGPRDGVAGGIVAVEFRLRVRSLEEALPEFAASALSTSNQ